MRIFTPQQQCVIFSFLKNCDGARPLHAIDLHVRICVCDWHARTGRFQGGSGTCQSAMDCGWHAQRWFLLHSHADVCGRRVCIPLLLGLIAIGDRVPEDVPVSGVEAAL